MLWIPQKGPIQVQHNLGTVGTLTPGTSVTTGGAAATKGTPAQLIASTNFDVYFLKVYAWAYGAAATDSQGMMDILVGAATEEVLIPNLIMGYNGIWSSSTVGPRTWSFPLYIPAGTRIAVQAAGQRVSTAFTVGISCYGGYGYPPFRVGRKVTTYGVGTVPFGTTVVPGASAAEGAWTQITASTTEDHFAFLPGFQTGTDTTMTGLVFHVDVGTGSATELEIGQSFMFRSSSDERYDGSIPDFPCFADVPSGTRLALRASCSGVLDAGNYNAVIHAVS